MSKKECDICGNDSLTDYLCTSCDAEEVSCSDEMHYLDEEERLYEYTSDGESQQIKCSACGGDTFYASYHRLCGPHEHREAKDERRGL